MGIWGSGLYCNDIALDVKNQFETMYNSNKSVKTITEKLIDDFKNIMGDSIEEPLFWFALADTQWEYGLLMPDVKAQALNWIEKGCTMPQFQITGNGTDSDLIGVLDALKLKLLTPQPPVKKTVKKRVYKCQWELGDVFAYRLESDLAKERGLWGQYFLIQKVDEGVWHPGHIVPIIYVKITKDSKLPLNTEEFNKLEYVQTRFTKYEERFWPIDMEHFEEDIIEKSKLVYYVDEYGFLPQYRIMLLNTSKDVIPSKLIYVGNFLNSSVPKNEFIPHTKDNISFVFWENFDETFETKMIKLFCGHNLREFNIYSNRRI